jgi:hypothetical protein
LGAASRKLKKARIQTEGTDSVRHILRTPVCGEKELFTGTVKEGQIGVRDTANDANYIILETKGLF